MSTEVESGQKRRTSLRAALTALAILALALFLPPFVSVNRYKGQITGLVSRSFGRPVRLSSVEIRLLPWPGFVLTDLSVAEDPAYGTEPVLHASKVTASIRLLALWRGRLEIGSISVDDASLNLVRAGPGKWNLDPLFRSAAVQAGSEASAASSARFPSLQATDSRINFKNGVEKLPFSLVNADLSIWQENSGEWRIRLRGQPARTDVSLYQEDTGIVRIEAIVHRAPALRLMPLHLDVDWRQAQLGQLARLVTGSDPGWRGDLTGELHLDGNADAAQVSMRLRAAGVHRAEFVPISPMDFDANCNLVYHYTQRSVQNLLCDSPLGDGRIHLSGEKPGADAPAHFSVELDRVPAGAGLDALRTVRSGLQPDLEATGTVSGKLVYAEDNAPPAGTAGKEPSGHASLERSSASRSAKLPGRENGPLSGSLTVENLAVTGGGLARPIQAPKFTLEAVSAEILPSRPTPATLRVPQRTGAQRSPTLTEALSGSVALPEGGTVPLTFALHFSLSGYQVGAHGQASIPRARELAHLTGIPGSAALEGLAGDAIAVDLTAEGPWLQPEEIPFIESAPPTEAASTPDAASGKAHSMSALGVIVPPAADVLTGTVTLHNASWKADYLANRVQVAEAVLHFDSSGLRWDPVTFSYGPLEGTATLNLPQACRQQDTETECPAQLPPSFSIAFAALDAGSIQTTLLGARQPGTLLSTLIERIHPSSAPPWPQMQGAVSADSLILGPVTLEKVSAALRIDPDGVEIDGLDAGLLNGSVHLTGTVHKPATDQDQPSYSITGDFQNLDSKPLGSLLGLHWTGGAVSGNGSIALAGYSDSDLAASAKGTLHIEARYGSIAPAEMAAADAPDKTEQIPPSLEHFDRMTADAAISGGVITLGTNQVISRGRKRSVAATVTFGNPPALNFTAPSTVAQKH
jgi:hypothetical protein